MDAARYGKTGTQSDDQSLALQAVAQQAVYHAKQCADCQNDEDGEPWRYAKPNQIEEADICRADDERNGEIQPPEKCDERLAHRGDAQERCKQ
ncbi:hypothetical protein D3C72_2284660 [compost metagenome]